MQCDHVKKKAAKQKSSEAESFKHMKINIWRILYTWRWPSRPKHVVKDSENQNTIKLHADGNVTCKNSLIYVYVIYGEYQNNRQNNS
jgi:hypothetical protein